jgi:hypothetical protein
MFSGARGKSPQRITRASVPVLPIFATGNKKLKVGRAIRQIKTRFVHPEEASHEKN